ncbi:hypothetical protein Pmar_PMAR009196 [Perkinsus marinus ATCC 50983]|uniref:Uncharacterized protein n=1 Tax=Perkinsus marinus (strain ATCC 50983 / TXsc) TaxID=423536 RepID=C5LE20_PERM5|nr:hypothetical protein Pmar_PMAR009196 [Perkinsus marinus ATCC 50983]EER05018.1 hypothetical protein Pmar_PMAR009196 [Perkinsus marinus ATCC 50983]|eukprot:XP_002773202.1 hypothetical protein Pmar_PMAR009196 [Perkinsus marinus ATCC 50983]
MACAFYNKLDQVRSGDVVWRGDGINNVEYRLMNEFVKADDSDVFAGKDRRYIRDFPACIGQANDGSGAGLKHRINVGTDWCGDQGWTHLIGLKVLHPDDVKYVPVDDLLTICISVSPQGWVYRFIQLPEVGQVAGSIPGHCISVHIQLSQWLR